MPEKVPVFLPKNAFQRLLDHLCQQFDECYGPVVRDGAIQYLPLNSVSQLPLGVGDVQTLGAYHLETTESNRYFAWANGPKALKPLTFRAEQRLWTLVQDEAGQWVFKVEAETVPSRAVLGVRACDLGALALQKQHFLEREEPDLAFKAGSEALFLVAVDCSQPSANCFCASTGDGPEASSGFDLALTELDEGFLVRAGSQPGSEFLQGMALRNATEAELQEAQSQQQRACQQPHHLPVPARLAKLSERQEHPYWHQVARQCLACGNCTAVCPSCFCSSYESRPAFDGASAEQWRLWDSCFNFEHSNLHGHPVRADTRLRYRQWITHKLAGWQAQFGRTGCTGCGRCITWCPVGIDIRQVVEELLQGEPE